MFKCDWWDIGHRGRSHIDEYGFFSVNMPRTWYNDDPYILANQAKELPQQSGSANNAAFQLPHQHGSASTGKGKSQSLLPTRTSPRKTINVRLFGARKVIVDDPSRAKEAVVESQEINQ
ncbi:hypothetical protein FNV43_RR02674 [Rhamnella rubrinervis]|uniref:DUF4216 domain-containing protein n=1 Tax=Rhamnella rubrinervis TaxID=2594499 RepID=A0A8K0HRX0_9ROSA|nr:hypothetical protein FNV43_RR02674 [Rhamnella rubrinervis]